MSIDHLKEMKWVACMGCKRLMDCDESLQDQCGFMVLIEALYEAGYRKSSDVAEEIFAEIERTCVDTFGCFYMGATFGPYAELKKKYTEGEE